MARVPAPRSPRSAPSSPNLALRFFYASITPRTDRALGPLCLVVAQLNSYCTHLVTPIHGCSTGRFCRCQFSLDSLLIKRTRNRVSVVKRAGIGSENHNIVGGWEIYNPNAPARRKALPPPRGQVGVASYGSHQPPKTERRSLADCQRNGRKRDSRDQHDGNGQWWRW
ncbi:hypothetical protein EI94DRAFT_1744075 [Lactarius quietus]|nr:hypothetical protein EI94DRAFT_1744075 [Lactarius quietus]